MYKNKSKGFVANVMLSFISIVIIVLILELMFRVLSFSTIEMFPYPKYYFISNKILGHDINPNIRGKKFISEEVKFNLFSNSLGCFDKEEKIKNSKILFIGDSFSFGIVPIENRFSSVVEDYMGIGTLNCGVPSFGTLQVYLKSKDIANYINEDIDIVIYSYFMNDFDDDIFFPNIYVIDGYPISRKKYDYKNNKVVNIPVKLIEKQYTSFSKCQYNSLIRKLDCKLKKSSVLYVLFRKSLKSIYLKFFASENDADFFSIRPYFIFSKEYRASKYWERHIYNIKSLKVFWENQGKIFIVLIIPTKEQIYTNLLKCKDYRNYISDYIYLTKIDVDEDLYSPIESIVKFLDKNGISYINLLPVLKVSARKDYGCWLDKNKDFYYTYDGHFNQKGNFITGLIISACLSENFENGKNRKDDIYSMLKMKFNVDRNIIKNICKISF